jgi:hypothetical protein
MPTIVRRCFGLTISHTFLQGYQDVRDRMIHRSTSQGSINSPVYSRHSYTPTTSRSPQHFHRPGKDRSPLELYHIRVCICMIFLFTPLAEYWKPWPLNISSPLKEQTESWCLSLFCIMSLKSVILSLCSLWAIKFHFDIDLLRTKDIFK